MTKILTITLLITAFSLGLCAQTKQYAEPHELKIESLVRRTFPSYFGKRQRYPQLIPENFYPIGWSRDGKFAYYVEPVDEACGCYFAMLVIQDMRTDKEVWKFKYSQDDSYVGDKMTGPGDIRSLWKKNQKLFSEKLAENGIVASRSVMLGKTFTSGGRRFTASAMKKRGPNADGYEDRVNLYTISLSAPKLGTKKVFTSEDHTKDDYWFMLDAGLIGVISSPFEDRVAIIAVEVMRGYEGPPHTGDIRLVGADLKSGFEKQ